MPISLNEALNLILTDPRTLLDNAFVPIAGGDRYSFSTIATFAITKPAAEQNMYQRAGVAVPTFRVQVLPGGPNYPAKFTGDGGEETLTFTAFYIAMKPMATAGSIPSGTRFTLPGAGGGSEICLTSQLSGCTFGIGSQVVGGCCLVSHIQPPVGALAGAQATMAAQTQTLFGAAPRKLVEKGAANDYADRAHVIGKRTYGHWDFFMQPFTGGHGRVLQPVVDL